MCDCKDWQIALGCLWVEHYTLITHQSNTCAIDTIETFITLSNPNPNPHPTNMNNAAYELPSKISQENSGRKKHTQAEVLLVFFVKIVTFMEKE